MKNEKVYRKMQPYDIIIYFIFAIITLVVLIPCFITVSASFKSMIEIGKNSPLALPETLNLENYKVVFYEGKILQGFVNSLILVLVSVVCNMFIGSMTAYAIHRFEFRLKPFVMLLFLLGMVVPNYITEIARFTVIKNMGIYNTLLAPIVIYIATDLMQLYIYTQFIEKIPRSLDESAMLDGCSYFGIYFKIIFPLLMPATATLSIIKAVDVINDMYIPYLYMPSARLRTMTTTLMTFSNSMFGDWRYLSAAIVLVAIPTVIIYLIFQKQIFEGIVAGSVKE